MASGAGTNSSSASVGCSSSSSAKEGHFWKYVTKVHRFENRGGNVKIKCNFCNEQFTGSHSRVRAHLLKISGTGVRVCKKVDIATLKQLRKEDQEAESKKAAKEPTHVPLPSEQVNPSSKRKKGPIEKAFNTEGRTLVDEEIGRLFYSAGLPFNVAKNPHFVKMFRLINELNLRGYVPPSYNALRTTILAKERANIERCLQSLKETWVENGVSIVSDGWTDTQRRPLINFTAVSASGPMFLKAVNCEGEYKDKFFISRLMKEVIENVGSRNVVQVVTDNAPVCKAAGQLVEAQYPHIFWTLCVVYTLNLALKSICAARNTEGNEEAFYELHWIKEVSYQAFQIKNFIVNHNMRLAIYNNHAHLKLLSIAETRFASVLVMLRRFQVMKQHLASMVVSVEWNTYREDDVLKAQEVKATVLDDLWWDNVDYILEFTSPIYEMLRFADTDKPSLHLIYEMWDSMIEKVKKIIFRHEKKELHEESSFHDVINEILISRWTKSYSPLHCLAHSLNPRYYSRSWLNEDPNRVPPNRDVEITNERNKCFARLFPNDEARSAVRVEYVKFSGLMGGFLEHDCLQDRVKLEPLTWWHMYGLEAPNLQLLAFKLLSQPSSSSCCERNWSTYQFIVSMRRNKLLPQRADDLVFVHNNLRLLSRSKKEYIEGPTRLWDIGGDAYEIGDGAEQLEIADLSLDDPEMEAMLFVDDLVPTNEDDDEELEMFD